MKHPSLSILITSIIGIFAITGPGSCNPEITSVIGNSEMGSKRIHSGIEIQGENFSTPDVKMVLATNVETKENIDLTANKKSPNESGKIDVTLPSDFKPGKYTFSVINQDGKSAVSAETQVLQGEPGATGPTGPKGVSGPSGLTGPSGPMATAANQLSYSNTKSNLVATNVQDAIDEVAKRSVSKVRLTSPQTIQAGDTFQKVLFDNKIFDELNEWDLTKSRFVAQTAGYYVVALQTQFCCSMPAQPGTGIAVGIYKNGNRGATLEVTARSYMATAALSDIIYLDKGNFLELYVQQDSGSPQPLTAGPDAADNYMAIAKIQ
jgi:hypothetical protein